MRSKAPFVILALFLFSSIACGFSVGATQTPSPAAAEPTQGSVSAQGPTGASPGSSAPAGVGSKMIETVTLAKGVQGDQNEPVDQTEVFAPQDKTIHAVVGIRDAPADTKFSAAWYAVEVGQAAAPNTLIDKTDITTDGTRNIDFTLASQDIWPVGTYRVDFSVNDQKVKTVEFSIK